MPTHLRSRQGGIHRHHRQAAAGLLNVPAIFRSLETRRRRARGGLFSIFVCDLCKGCGECVQVCGDHDALRMTRETEELNAELTTAQIFSRLLPGHAAEIPRPLQRRRRREFPRGRACAITSWSAATTRRSSPATARAPVAAKRASCARRPRRPRPTCARFITARPTGSVPRPTRLEQEGAASSSALKARSEAEYQLFRKTFAHVVMGLGGENEADTARGSPPMKPSTARSPTPRSSAAWSRCCGRTRSTTATCRRSTAAAPTACRVMFMGASTGCNTVYGSTPPSNPHPYPWMNSLFQDGATISWLHGRIASSSTTPAARSCPNAWPTRLLERADESPAEADYFTLDPPGRRADDRAGDPRIAEGLGRRRRRRARRHRLPERLEGDPAEPAEREDAHARHPGLLEHRRPELRFAPPCSAATT